ncbi:MAG: nucleotidyltransferase family protein [Gammaproteobacteria bacterium]|nr:nucleotidyltransferase family protein [Gammaproteobacteria bacterium]MBT5204769.1 nucleotidyltransferase family protein [Gammaproteobacteria bacterium]MBT5601605.1 nucleotidyltransferase family protein [Gammaproteobacteria bacterium]MBT6244709.1 nucleotidyltransferase family protein [Gammaproteobacteria bacterium]
MLKIGALILAAGSSRRFGDDKRRSRLASGQRLLETTIANVNPRFAEIMVILRQDDNHLAEELQKQFRGLLTYLAPDSALGMGHSLSDGIKQVSSWQASAIFMGDMPFIQPETIELLLDRYSLHESNQPIIVPTCQGRTGHPVIFSKAYYPELTVLTGDEGAKSIVRAYADHVIQVPCLDSGVLRDIDVPEDLSHPSE